MKIGNCWRDLKSWAPSRRKLVGVKPDGIDVAALPETFEIAGFPLDYDQGELGSCGPNALAEIYQHTLGDRYSRLFSYFFTRATEGDFIDDAGVTVPDLIGIAHTMGMPLESTWPYELGKFQVPPPMGALVEAVRHRVEESDIIVDLDHLLYELANDQPVILGFQVPASMQGEDTARTGIVNVPSGADPVVGGHCVCAIGASRDRRLVKCTSHWGSTFGDGGAIWLPFDMWSSGDVMDMFAVRRISSAP